MRITTKLEDKSLEWLITYHSAITSERKNKPDFWDSMVAQVEQLIKLKRLKEKKVKNIVIKLENNLLTKYVINKLITALDLQQPHTTTAAFEKCIMCIKIDSGTIYSSCGIPSSWAKEGAKTFVITSASNADIIIEEVIKEYRTPEYRKFTIGGGFNGNTIKVKVYSDYVEFNGQTMNFDTFIGMRNALTLEYGGFKVGGDSTLLLTNGNTGTKVYIDRSELHPIVESILGKL